jgi:hypothetical protein
MPAIVDRVLETTTTTGTGNITLAGATTGYQTFNSRLGTNAFFWYCIETPAGAEWEIGTGYLSASTTLVRDSVMYSSNSDALVSFSSGTKNVFITKPANTFSTQGRTLAQVNKQPWF